MPCGYVYPTVIGARERFSIVIFIFRVRPLHFARSTPKGNTRASISGMSNGKVLTLYYFPAKPENHMPDIFSTYNENKLAPLIGSDINCMRIINQKLCILL